MSDTVVFVFPSQSQFEVIASAAGFYDGEVVVVIPEHAPLPGLEGLRVLREREITCSYSSALRQARWSCCGEMGVYFVSAHREMVGQLPFGAVCLDMLTKLQMQDVLGLGGARPTPKRLLTEASRTATLTFPHILKPNFGFNSNGVKRVASPTELSRCVARFTATRAKSLAHDLAVRYLRRYDPTILDELLVEPDLSDHLLYYVPFYVIDGQLTHIYPVRCEECESHEDSDYEWNLFVAPVTLTEEQELGVHTVLERIIACCGLQQGVFHSELLIDPRDGGVQTLEFSPRVSGGSICELVREAVGVDLQRLAVATMLDIALCTAEPVLDRNCWLVRSRRDAPLSSTRPGSVRARYQVYGGGVAYIDTLYSAGSD